MVSISRYCPNLNCKFCHIFSFQFHPKFLHYNFFITKIFQHNLFFFFQFSLFTSNFVHHKTPLRPHSVQYSHSLLGQFSSPGYPSAVHDRVCSLKRSTHYSASPALLGDMTGSNNFYCDQEIIFCNLSLKTKKHLFYILLIVHILVFM